MPNYRRYARRAAAREGIDPDIFERQIEAESNFDPDAVSPAGATGIAQIMPATAKGWGVDPRKPRQSLKAAAKAMAGYLRDFHGDWRLALAAYNAGPGNAARALQEFEETKGYVQKILDGKHPKAKGGGGGGRTVKIPGVPVPTARTVQEFDRKGFEQAERRQRLATFLAEPDTGDALDSLTLGRPRTTSPLGTDGAESSSLFKAGLLSTEPVSPTDFMRDRTVIGEKKIGGYTMKVPAKGDSPVLADTAKRTAGEMLKLALRVDKKNLAGKLPYKWGGGHGLTPAQIGELVDCSGFVSQILGVTPRVSGQFQDWGKPGRGKFVTVYANPEHVLMSIRDPRTDKMRWFGTSRSNPGGGAGEIDQPSAAYLSTFTARHPGRAGGRRKRRRR